MTKEFFKELCRRAISEILEGVPDGEFLQVYHSHDEKGEYISIECGKYKYTHYASGKEVINEEKEESLNDD